MRVVKAKTNWRWKRTCSIKIY